MRKYGSSKRNPNPPWPCTQTAVVVPPGSNSTAIGVGENSNERVFSVAELQREEYVRDDGLPIMNYTTGGGVPLTETITTSSANSCEETSLSSYLCKKIGNYAKIEFMFGENTHIEKTGLLEGVGRDFVVLREAGTGTKVICPVKNIKFINIYNVKQNT